ncbi:MAG: NAD(P)-dependent oxidoreductase [Opitutales bacterium]
MKVWKNTKTLDALLPELSYSEEMSLAEFAIIGSKPIPLSEFPCLKGLFKCGVGVDNVPFEEAEERGVKVFLPSDITREIIYTETAHFTCHLILKMLLRGVGNLETWTKTPRRALGSNRLLVIGNGNIGRKVAAAMEPFVEVDTYDVLNNAREELEGKVRYANIVSLHLPLTEETRSFMDDEKLSWMQDGTILINTARGPIVDEGALLREVSNGRLKAAFDVFWQEPYQGALCSYHPHDFYMTPHISSNSTDFLDGLAVDCRAAMKLLTN